MKRMGILGLLVLAGVLSVLAVAFAQMEISPLVLNNPTEFAPANRDFIEAINYDSYGRGNAFPAKLADGVLNAATGLADVPKRIQAVSDERNVFEGYTIGFVEGIFMGIFRTATGSIDMATFLIPPYDEPLMIPEYEVEEPQKEGWKIKIFTW